LKGRLLDGNERLISGGSEILPPKMNGVRNFTSEFPVIHGEVGTFVFLDDSGKLNETLNVKDDFITGGNPASNANAGKALYYIFTVSKPTITQFSANVTFNVQYLFPGDTNLRTINYKSNHPFMVIATLHDGPLISLSTIIPIVVPGFNTQTGLGPGSSITIS